MYVSHKNKLLGYSSYKEGIQLQVHLLYLDGWQFKEQMAKARLMKHPGHCADGTKPRGFPLQNYCFPTNAVAL